MQVTHRRCWGKCRGFKRQNFQPAQMYTLDSYESNAPHLCFFTKNPLMLHHWSSRVQSVSATYFCIRPLWQCACRKTLMTLKSVSKSRLWFWISFQKPPMIRILEKVNQWERRKPGTEIFFRPLGQFLDSVSVFREANKIFMIFLWPRQQNKIKTICACTESTDLNWYACQKIFVINPVPLMGLSLKMYNVSRWWV